MPVASVTGPRPRSRSASSHLPVTVLSRSALGAAAAPPARIAHLGLGGFFRAHPCWYTDRAPDGGQWGFAAFTGRSSAGLPADLAAQDGLYTLIERGPQQDGARIVRCLADAHPAADHEAWLRVLASAGLAAVTITVTEAGYLARRAGGLDFGRVDVQADAAALRADPVAKVRTAPGRLVAGLAARRRAGAGPVAVVPCDNVQESGALTRRVVLELAEAADPGLADWIAGSVRFVSTVVDRITPRPAPTEAQAAQALTGWADRCPVVTEPFAEWVLCGQFPAGRPDWPGAGALITDDLTPYEQRKLWLLNGAHSLLAYAGSMLGHHRVPQAFADEICRSWVADWWSAASPHLSQSEPELAAYQTALGARFSNTRLSDRLERIAEDGSQKLPNRILPVLRAERAAGRLPAAATRILAAWVCHLRGLGAPVSDVAAAEIVPLASGPLRQAVPAVLRWLDPELGADGELTGLVAAQCGELTALS
jgi:fructuronate reductase